MDIERKVDSEFGEGSLELLEVKCAFVFIFGREDDACRQDAAWGVAVDDTAVCLAIPQLLDGALGEIGKERGDPLNEDRLGGCRE